MAAASITTDLTPADFFAAQIRSIHALRGSYYTPFTRVRTMSDKRTILDVTSPAADATGLHARASLHLSDGSVRLYGGAIIGENNHLLADLLNDDGSLVGDGPVITVEVKAKLEACGGLITNYPASVVFPTDAELAAELEAEAALSMPAVLADTPTTGMLAPAWNGTISIDPISGNTSGQAQASVHVDAGAQAQSFRYSFASGASPSLPADATVASSGTLVSASRILSIANLATLHVGDIGVMTIVPFTGTGGGGTQLPTIHLRAAYTSSDVTTAAHAGHATILRQWADKIERGVSVLVHEIVTELHSVL